MFGHTTPVAHVLVTPTVPMSPASDRATAQLVVIVAVTVTSVLLLIAILCLTVSAAVERFCPRLRWSRRRDEDDEDEFGTPELECRVFLRHDPESGNISGVIKQELVQPATVRNHPRGQGYEQMVALGSDGEHVYESVQ